MSDLIDEAVLENLFERIADDIPVPARGAEYVVDNLVHTTGPSRADHARVVASVLAVAAVFAGIVLALSTLSTSSASKSSSAARVAAPAPGKSRSLAPSGPAADPSQPVDGAKIVKTGTLDLTVPHSTLRVAVNRVSGVAVGLGGYVADSKTSYGGTDPTAQITIRIPVAKFESAITQLDALPDVKVLGESENGTDVTSQFSDLQAQLAAATSERDALLVVLSRAQSIGDILSVRDRVTNAQAEVNQLQGRINVLDRQATFSSLSVTLSERSASGAPAAQPGRTGFTKAWWDARHGFTSVVEWLLARSGAALIIVLFALALLFGVRYLYPIVRRGLV